MGCLCVPQSPDYITWTLRFHEVPPSPDYIPGPEEPQSPPPLDFVLEPMYLEYIPQEDEILLAEEHPIPVVASPTADSPGYVAESDPEEEPKEDDKDLEEDPADYPADRDDDDDDDEDEDEDEEEEEEHPAPADSVPPVHRMTARISIRDEPSISLPPREEVERLLALNTPPPSPLTPLSSPLPQIPSPPLPIPSPPPNNPTHIDIPESCLPLRKRVHFASPTLSHEVGESSTAGAARQYGPAVAREDPYSVARGDLYGFVDMVDVAPGHPMSRELDYGITDTWDDLVGAIDEIAPTTLEGVNQRVTDLSTIVEQETTIMYGIMEDAQDDRSQLRGRVNLLYRDRPIHSRLAVMVEREARMAREAWGLSMDASDYARSDVMSLRTTVGGAVEVTLDFRATVHQIKQETEGDFKDVGIETIRTRTWHQKRRTTRLNPSATPTPVTDTHTTTSVTNAQIQAMINEGVTAALAARDATRNGDDSHTSGTGARRPVQVARECTYLDFLKCQPLNFKGTEGVVGLTQWFEKMESVYSISNCTVACQVKFATCTLQGNALTWKLPMIRTTNSRSCSCMPWRTLKKMMTDKYCPRGEIKKLEFEMWNLKVKGNDVVTYSQRFQELALMCDRMFPEEIDQVEKYVGGLPDTIHGSVMVTKPKTMQDAIEFATELMDKKINTWAERQADNKRKSDDTARNNQNQQPNKRQNTGRAYAAGNNDRKPYGGPRPLCSKCNYHHDGTCVPKCHKCHRFGHLGRNCKNPPNVNTGANQRAACFKCGAQGHFKKDCPKWKNNNNRGNQAGNAEAQAKVYAVGNAGANPDNNVITDHDYNVELADGRIVGLNTIIRGCTLNLLNHPFNIDLMPVELGSFDVIIGMDWLVKYHAVIFCAEKIVRIPFGGEILIVRGDGSSNKHGTRLNIISCAKAQEYLTKGCHVFLANITATKDEDKSKEKRLEDVPIVQEFSEVFPEDLPGIPPTRQVELLIIK
ncbi:putative reverse transcriptase domain-containing protein [Tanacetum coccineum]